MSSRSPRPIRRAIVYLRVSTDEQSLGPEAQARAIADWAARRKVDVLETFAEDVSGAAPLTKRPALERALAAVKRTGADALVVAKWDRLARGTELTLSLVREVERLGAQVITADGVGEGDAPDARLMRNIYAAFAEHERDVIRARTKAAMAVKKFRGESVGQIAYGFRLAADGVHVEPNPVEQAVITEIRDLRRAGHSFRKIVDLLNRRGVPARPRNVRGAPPGRWRLPLVHRIASA